MTLEKESAALSYRPDIDGLRAIAVLAVVLYHFDIGPLNGGFVGVDVFFVISGYLITGIIFGEICRGTFTFAKFYQRRIRRLFPALFAMLVAVFTFGAIFLLPTDLILLGKATVATLLFGSNFLYWRTSGYFDLSSESNALLHTWSLAVEEQFYIVFPILLLLLVRHAKRYLNLILWIGTGATLILCIYFQASRPTATFFLSPFRAWELSIGALIALGALPSATTKSSRELLSGLGAILILGSIALTPSGAQFPGWYAIAPVAGAAMIIHAGASGTSAIQRLLCVRWLVLIGLMSYSIYLWHWPLLVFAKYLNALEPIDSERYLLLLIALSLAAASYWFVERPFRSQSFFRRGRVLFLGTFALSLPVLAAGGLVVAYAGYRDRFDTQIVQLDAERIPTIPFLECIDRPLSATQQNDFCVLGASNVKPTVLLWGDSHALAWAPAVDDVLRSRGMAAYFAGRSNCAPLIGMISPINVVCHDHNSAVALFLEQSPHVATVIMVASWPSYSNNDSPYEIQDVEGLRGNSAVFPIAISRTVLALRSLKKQIWLIGPTPGSPVDPQRMALRLLRGMPMPQPRTTLAISTSSTTFYSSLQSFSSDPNVIVTDPTSWLCSEGECAYAIEGLPLYRDGGHLNVRGAFFLRSHLNFAFSQMKIVHPPRQSRAPD